MRLGVEHIDRHFRSSPEVKKEIWIFKVNLWNQNLYHIIRSVFKCSKQMTPPEVEVSTSGYLKNKFQILNIQCLKSSLSLKCFTWNWYIYYTFEMSRVTSNDFEKVTSGYEIWSWEIEILLFHFLQNHERYSDGIFMDNRSLDCSVR